MPRRKAFVSLSFKALLNFVKAGRCINHNEYVVLTKYLAQKNGCCSMTFLALFWADLISCFVLLAIVETGVAKTLGFSTTFSLSTW